MVLPHGLPRSASHATRISSPIGVLLLVGRPGVLCGLYLADHQRCPGTEGLADDPAAFADATAQLGEYFAGRRRHFDLDIEVEGTAFQQEVWRALQSIPYGATISYGELAARVGRPSAVRAVGSANGRNPVSIIVPCHRVIGADGALSGYGWGPELKRRLLELERDDLFGVGDGLQHSEA